MEIRVIYLLIWNFCNCVEILNIFIWWFSTCKKVLIWKTFSSLFFWNKHLSDFHTTDRECRLILRSSTLVIATEAAPKEATGRGKEEKFQVILIDFHITKTERRKKSFCLTFFWLLTITFHNSYFIYPLIDSSFYFQFISIFFQTQSFFTITLFWMSSKLPSCFVDFQMNCARFVTTLKL